MHTKRSLTVNFIKSNGLWCAFLFILASLGSVLHIFIPLSVGGYFELLFDSNSTKALLLAWFGIKISSLNNFFVIFFSLTALLGIHHFVFKFVSGIVAEKFSQFVREKTFEAQMNHSLSVHRLKADGKYLLRYSGDLNAIQNFLTKGVIQFAADILFIVLFGLFTFQFSSFLSGFIAGLFILSYSITYALSKFTFQITRKRRTERSKLLGFVSSRMHAFQTIKAFNREKKELRSFQRRSKMLYNAGIRYAIKTSIVHGFIPLLFYTSLGISLYWLSYSSELQKPQAVAFVLMFLYMQTIMKRAQRTTLVWQFASVSFIKLTEIINFSQESKNETVEKSRFHKTLEVRNLSFKFEEDDKELLIAQLHFNIQENGIYWLKGKASSGKSTLLQLIQGLYTPTQGEILYDGVSHKQLTPFDIRRSVSTVSEELPILGGSVKKSILYNDDPRTISRALELMKHFHFKNEFTSEQILDFKLEDNARNLSASDRMKLQFVRAFATQKKIILLDNPFQSFDEATTLLAVNFLNRIESDYIILLTAGSLPKDLNIHSSLALTKQL